MDRLDRLAYQNMTNKGRGNQYDIPNDYTSTQYSQNFTNELLSNNNIHHNHGQMNYFEHNDNRGAASLNNFSQPIGELTSKSKMNAQVNNYHLERQSKNLGQYNNFVSALDNNIREDQHRTILNNDRLITEQREMDNFERIYHPGLSLPSSDPVNPSLEFDRNGVQTRDRRENGLARNKNTAHIVAAEDVPNPHPKLNYPQGYDQLTPMTMDMTSHIELQFKTLTDQDMEQQIHSLQSKPSKQNQQPIHGQMPYDRQTIFQAKNQPAYNPHADYMNQKLQQMSEQMPENKNSVNNQLSNMNAMYNLNNLPEIPNVPSLNFLRPVSSNVQNVLQPNNSNSQQSAINKNQNSQFNSWDHPY